MVSRIEMTLCTEDICQQIAISEADVADLVSHGIIDPYEPAATLWHFDESVLVVIARAMRLKQDLQLNWAGVALALELLDELEALRRENRSLLSRLSRLEHA